MNKKFDPVAFLAAAATTLLASFFAASIYELDLKEIFQSGFWGAPMYFFVFFGFVGFPIYVWVRYFRTHAKRKSSKTVNHHSH